MNIYSKCIKKRTFSFYTERLHYKLTHHFHFTTLQTPLSFSAAPRGDSCLTLLIQIRISHRNRNPCFARANRKLCFYVSQQNMNAHFALTNRKFPFTTANRSSISHIQIHFPLVLENTNKLINVETQTFYGVKNPNHHQKTNPVNTGIKL